MLSPGAYRKPVDCASTIDLLLLGGLFLDQGVPLSVNEADFRLVDTFVRVRTEVIALCLREILRQILTTV